ncbi:hypothetical protein [Ruegeria arenilitoris]|uniref:hypothetical protein n=1 Tax=Ruegeria arenilitoris TaxID=1173585 RepID=UPI00147E5B31|nr:hypothetical protein [Ruegeria arenilitoris]
MKKYAATSLFLAISSSAVLAYSGPQSHFVEFDCTIIQKCDHQFLCKKTDESTQIAYTALVHDLSVSKSITPIDYPFDTWQEVTAWVDFINPRAGKLPLPVWYLDDAGFDPEITFRLEDWLNGQQDSPYNVKGYALVMTGDLEEISYSRANLDKDDDLPWEITVYRKFWGEPGKYHTQKLLCDSD